MAIEAITDKQGHLCQGKVSVNQNVLRSPDRAGCAAALGVRHTSAQVAGHVLLWRRGSKVKVLNPFEGPFSSIGPFLQVAGSWEG